MQEVRYRIEWNRVDIHERPRLCYQDETIQGEVMRTQELTAIALKEYDARTEILSI